MRFLTAFAVSCGYTIATLFLVCLWMLGIVEVLDNYGPIGGTIYLIITIGLAVTLLSPTEEIERAVEVKEGGATG